MNNKIYIYLTLVLFSFVLFTNCSKRHTELPNIIIIFTDDQGYGDLGCYGAEGFETPNIDMLANEGVQFTSFYVSEAVCSASRASLLTGCYAQRLGIRGALNPIAFTGLNPTEATIATMLRSKGYKTAIFGKWHLGHRLEFLPVNFGFDEYFGLAYSNDMWPVDYDGLPVNKGYKSLYPTLCLIEDSVCVKEIHTLKDQSELTTLYTQKAVEFIYRNKDEPFFLYLPHSMVHVPIAASDKFTGKSKSGLYGDVMMEVDWSVGEVIRALEDNDLASNTLVIYTSDNGPWLNYGNHGGSSGPLREGKGTAWEGGVRVPCIINWPGKIKGGTLNDQLITSLDILPTIAAIVDAPLPARMIDGKNMLQMLVSDTLSPRKEFYYFYEGGLRAVRKGKWKLMLPHRSRSYEGLEPGKNGYPGETKQIDVELALYNLEKDPGERTDLSDEYPEVVSELMLVAEEVRKKLGDAINGITGNEVREVGRIGGMDSVQNLLNGKKVKLANDPSHRYSGHGMATLTDGKLGSMDFLDSQWLGFRGEDLDVFIDLGMITEPAQLKINFLKNQTSWIFLPGEIEVSTALNDSDFQILEKVNIDNGKRDLKIDVVTITFDINKPVRYIRLKATSIGNCPEWHPGMNEKGWLFTDEIILN